MFTFSAGRGKSNILLSIFQQTSPDIPGAARSQKPRPDADGPVCTNDRRLQISPKQTGLASWPNPAAVQAEEAKSSNCRLSAQVRDVVFRVNVTHTNVESSWTSGLFKRYGYRWTKHSDTLTGWLARSTEQTVRSLGRRG